MIHIKNGELKMYDISEKYRDYLWKFDDRVSLKNHRKFYGILVTKDEVDYYIPFTSQVNKRTSSKLTIRIKDKGKVIAKLLLNNMIPVNEEDAYIVNIETHKYKDYYNKEIAYLRSPLVEQELIRKIDYIHKTLSESDMKNKDYEFFKKICCDFRLLEKRCEEYKKKKS